MNGNLIITPLVVISVILLGLTILILLIYHIWCIISYYFIKKYPGYAKKTENHAAIILLQKDKYDRFLRYGEGIIFLIFYLRDIKRSYKIYKWLNNNELGKVIHNPKTKWIYIFGHGTHHAAKTSKDEYYVYCEAKNAPKKEFVGQYHCNRGPGKSLVEYIGKDGFVTIYRRTVFQNLYQMFKLYCNSKKTLISGRFG